MITGSFMVAARDVALVDGYGYGDVNPYTEAWPSRRLVAGNGGIRRTPVHRLHIRQQA